MILPPAARSQQRQQGPRLAFHQLAKMRRPLYTDRHGAPPFPGSYGGQVMKRRSTSHSSNATLQKRRQRQSPIARILTELRRQKVILSGLRDLRTYLEKHSRLARHLP